MVVCCYNSAATLEDCLEGLGDLAYPAYEVIVVDDGSTDGTSTIAERHDVRLIRTENRGLSRARNTGIEAARGEIVAFIDSDARPDPDWLTHLALALESSDFVGVGGPNIAPPGDGLVAACVAEAPGGPIHVLRTDREAEHIPGCNMAFRRAALLEIGGFDPQFRVAGDDVDLCWRFHARGWRIGFAPGAVVWHHARNSVRGYWKQQSGYGVAEAMLEAKWPEKYNVAGHVTWGGRVYGPGTLRFPFHRGRVYQGTWGQAPFQQREDPAPNVLWEAVAMPEWYMIIGALAVLALLGLSWPPLRLAGVFAACCGMLTLARAVVGARHANFDRQLGGLRERMAFRALALGLHLMQPLARLQGRWLRGLVPWRSRARSRRVLWPRRRQLRFWRGASVHPTASVLEHVEAVLRQEGCVVRRDGGYEDWDLEVEGGALGASRLRSLTEWHEGGHRLLRFSVEPHTRGLAWVMVVSAGLLGLWSLGAGATAAGLILVAAAALAGLRASWEVGTTSAALCDAICTAVERDHAAAVASQRAPGTEPLNESEATPGRDGPVWLPATG
ncbi:MAG: glycosyltransferase [Phycisphaerales bacterium JB038]